MAMNPDRKIDICIRTREYAQRCLLRVLQRILDKGLRCSEADIRDMWGSELQKNDALFSDGWYSPPPRGIAILIGSDGDGEQSRLNYRSLRPPELWPRDDIFLDAKRGIIYAYCSPIDRQTGIIGDFGITLYFGESRPIIEHLVRCRSVVKQVFDHAAPGTSFSQLATYTKTLIASYGLNNEIECKTSPSAADDVGHTIPFIMEVMSQDEIQVLNSQKQENIKDLISRKRIYVRVGEDQPVQNGMAFTIEPRPREAGNALLPMVSFHCICAVRGDGRKELVANFDELFHAAGMNYMM